VVPKLFDVYSHSRENGNPGAQMGWISAGI